MSHLSESDSPAPLMTDLPSPPPTKPPLKKRLSRRFHRILGLLTTLPILWITITGVLLNHTVDWKLDQIQLTQPWLLAAYGMTPTGNPKGLEIGGHQVTEWDGQIFFDHQALDLSGKLLGAVAETNSIAIVTQEKILRLDANGAVIETLESHALPTTPLTACAQRDGIALLRNASGWHRADADWMEFTPITDAPFTAQALSTLENPETIEKLREAWTRGGLPASRVILDLHAGRFLGSATRYFYDFAAACIIFLCLTGLMIYFRAPRRKR